MIVDMIILHELCYVTSVPYDTKYNCPSEMFLILLKMLVAREFKWYHY